MLFRSVWIGGGGEKRTLRTAARFADGWNVPYVSPPVWSAKNAVLDAWCEREGRDPTSIARTVNVGFYLGADARGATNAMARYQKDWPDGSPVDITRPGFLRGLAGDAGDMVAAYRDAGVAQLNIAVRAGPYDWDALAAFAEDVMPAFQL